MRSGLVSQDIGLALLVAMAISICVTIHVTFPIKIQLKIPMRIPQSSLNPRNITWLDHHIIPTRINPNTSEALFK